jgi:hypothetical protein
MTGVVFFDAWVTRVQILPPQAVHLKTMLQQSQATELLGHWQRQLRLEFGFGSFEFKKPWATLEVKFIPSIDDYKWGDHSVNAVVANYWHRYGNRFMYR